MGFKSRDWLSSCVVQPVPYFVDRFLLSYNAPDFELNALVTHAEARDGK